MNKHILVVDDEASIRGMLTMALEQQGFSVSAVGNAHQADALLRKQDFDLILLDWMMPGAPGIDFAARLRRQDRLSKTGIIMLTAKDDEDDLIRGLEVGADDYVTKPFSTRELISRIGAVLRRIGDSELQGATISAGRITVDVELYQVRINDKPVDFSPTEFRLLHFLLSHPDRVFDREQLLNNVWGEQVYVEDRTVDVHIRRLRKVLEPYDCDSYITTVRGVGYRFSGPAKG